MNQKELQKKSKEWQLHQKKSYSNELMRFRSQVLNNKKELTKHEIQEVEKLNFFFLMERHKDQVSDSYKMRLANSYKESREKHSLLVKIVISNFEYFNNCSPNYFNLLILYCGNHPFKKQRKISVDVANYLLKYFDNIKSHKREHLVSILVNSVNIINHREIRRLFHRKFNFIGKHLKNELLLHYIEDDNTPVYYLKSFLRPNKHDVSIENIDKIQKRLDNDSVLS